MSVVESLGDYGHLCFKHLIWNILGQFPLGVSDAGRLLGKTDCWENLSGLLVSWA